MEVVAAETPRRRALGFPPFGGLAEVRGGAPTPVAAACAAVAATGLTVLGPGGRRTPGSSRALLRAPSVAALCDALAHRPSTPPGPRAACGSTSIRAGSDATGQRSDPPPPGNLEACIRCASSVTPC